MTTTNISCPHCEATNRLPTARLAESPTCGKCKKPLFSGQPIELTETNLSATLNNNDIPVLVDCWAEWCGPCKSFAPIFTQAAQQMEPRLRLAKLDTQAQQEIAARWQIRSIPTLILFKQGKELARVAGALSLTQLQQWLAQQGIQLNS